MDVPRRGKQNRFYGLRRGRWGKWEDLGREMWLREGMWGETARVEGHFRGWYGNLVQWKLLKIYEGNPYEVSK